MEIFALAILLLCTLFDRVRYAIRHSLVTIRQSPVIMIHFNNKLQTVVGWQPWEASVSAVQVSMSISNDDHHSKNTCDSPSTQARISRQSSHITRLE